MRQIGAALSAALGAPVQHPAVLVQIGFSTPMRWSSAGPVNWNGFTWSSRGIDVRNLAVQAYTLNGTLVLDNSDNVLSGLVLNEGITDRAIRIWAFDAAAPTEFVWQCDALGGGSQVADMDLQVNLRHPCDGLMSPRTFVNGSAFGNHLPDGVTITINGQDMRLDRGKY